MPDQLAELVPAPLDAPVPSRGADVASTWDAQGSHSSLPRYKLCFAMCWTTPSGTRYHTGRPALTRFRQSVDEIAIAGISTSDTPLLGKPLSDNSCPGRVTPTKCAKGQSSSAFFHVRICARASAPVITNN